MTQIAFTDPTKVCLVADFYHGNSANFAKLKAAQWNGIGCPAIIMKCTQGAGYVDPAYKSRAATASSAGFLVAAYHFGTAESAQTQANNFLTHAAPTETTGLWLDYEDNRASQMTLALAVDFMDAVDQATGRTCGVYSGNTLKEAITKATSSQRDFLAAHAYWLADYALTPFMVDVDRKQLPWDVPFLHQFTGDGSGPAPHTLDGLENGCDLSIFRGSAEQLAAAWPLPKMETPTS
jgi:GH25 family lysozyme M1 (1,4-beta-N-acetylmuramidase)